MKNLLLILIVPILAACAPDKNDKQYRVFTSETREISFLKEHFQTNNPFPIHYETEDGSGECLLWLSGVHNDSFNRSAYTYSISNCANGPKSEGGSYELDGTGLVLCENNIQCMTYEAGER